MEGAGEGVVAILQGTKHAGLRVTLIPDNRLRTKRKPILMDLGVRPPTRITQSSVETNTERVFKNASEPMCDVRYASGYQFSNCKSVQSSFRVSEFPQHSTFYRQSDQFAESLRKYPVQASSEILQRIINYSNIKQNTRKQNIRSIRSLLRKSTSQQMNRRCESVGVKDVKVNTNNELYTKRPLNKSISVIGSRYSSRKELLNYTYDYLKCMSLIPRCTDVRYLTQVKKCIRNRLLQIVDDRPSLCPRIRRRYSHHKKLFHGSVTKATLTSDNNEIQESSETTNFTHLACTNFSKHKSCFCHQPKTCNCTPKLHKQDPLESFFRKLYPELNGDKQEIYSKQFFFDPKIQKPKDITNKLCDGLNEKIMTAVSEWLKSIPVYPNFSANDKKKQEELAFKLAEKLTAFKNDIDFISKAKIEIMSCVNDLPMWYPPDLNEKKQFLDRIVADLLQRLVNLLENELKDRIAQAISNLSYTEDVDKEKIVDDFVNKLKVIANNPPEDERDYEEALKLRILDILNQLPVRSTTQKIQDIADRLVEQLLEFPLSKTDDEQLMTEEIYKIRENILKWCENMPELEHIDFSQNIDLINELANKFKYYETRAPNEESLQSELVKTIRVWLEDAADTMNLRLNSKTKNRLSNKMAIHFFGKDLNNTLSKRKSSDICTSDEALEPLLKWYYGIQELAGGKRVDILKALNTLAKDLKDIQSRDSNFENMLTDMKKVVTDWLQNMLIKKGKHLESKDFDNLVNQLITELNDMPKRKKHRRSYEYGQFYRDIISWIKNIPYLKPGSHLTQNKIIGNFAVKLNDIREEPDNESKIIEAVTDFIQSLSENLEVQIKDRDIKLLMDKLFESLPLSSKQRKRWDKVNDLCQSIYSEYSKNLQGYSNILSETKLNNIRDKFYSKVTENLEENGLPNWNYLSRQLNNIIKQETKFPKHECKDLANSIIAKIQRMFPHEITRRSTILSQAVKAYVDPARILEHNRYVRKKHKTQTGSDGRENAYSKYKSKKAHYRKINPQAGGDGRKNRKHSKISTIYKSSNSDLGVHDSVDYYNNNYEISDNQNEHSESDKHEELPHSTPLSTVLKNLPTSFGIESPIRNITEDTKNSPSYDSELSKQPDYLMKLKNVIRDWIQNIDPSINNFDLNDVVDGIASDIIDRQKYLQLSEAKYSENDEIEHLKYQIFRKLNKLKKNDILPKIMSKIRSLHHIIKNISVPDLTTSVNESHMPSTSRHSNSIYNKISHWLDRVPSDLLKSSNIKQNPAFINKLVKNLENQEMSDEYDYQIEKDILMWLQNILRNSNDKILHELREDLRSTLKEIIPKTSNVLKETNESLGESISKAIGKWLQTAKFYKNCSSQERKLQENLASLLATNLTHFVQATKHEGEGLNDLLIGEVQKYLKTIPMTTEFRNDSFYYKTASELIEYLKQTIPTVKEICDGIQNTPKSYKNINTHTDFKDYKDLVKNIINNWCDNLPIHLGHSFESKEQAEKLKHNIAKELLEKLSNINLMDRNNNMDSELMLSEEIDKIFKNVPMNRELEKSLPILKSILIEKLKQAKIKSQSLVPKKILHDTLTKTLQEIENTSDLEGVSFNLLKEKLADAFINLHCNSLTDYEFRDKLKDKLHNEINKFCDGYLERYPYSPINSDDLRFNLYSTLKKALNQDMQQFGTSDESPKSSFEKGITLKNATTQYTSPHFLPSTLSIKDRAHLEEIRKRAAGFPETVNSDHRYKDLSSKFKDTEIQTDGKENIEENVQTSKTLLSDTISYNSKEIVPQVVIKEFYWDSNRSKQSLEMFVPPALTPHKILPQNIDTTSSKNQTETNIINNSTKLHISQKMPDIREVRNNKNDRASNVTSPNSNEKHEHRVKSYENSSGLQNDDVLISPTNSIHRHQSEKPFHQYHRRRDSRVHDNGLHERYWYEQPRFDNDRYIRKESRQPNYLEDFVQIRDDRRILTPRIFWTPENRNKENIYCDHHTNWRMGTNTCRRRCNTLKHCSKCCGGFCPHPTCAFFKKTY